jgi:hypothetical protein
VQKIFPGVAGGAAWVKVSRAWLGLGVEVKVRARVRVRVRVRLGSR